MNELQRILVSYVHHSSDLATKLAMISCALAIIQAIPPVSNLVFESVKDEEVVDRVRRISFYSSAVMLGISVTAFTTLAVVNAFTNIQEEQE